MLSSIVPPQAGQATPMEKWTTQIKPAYEAMCGIVMRNSCEVTAADAARLMGTATVALPFSTYQSLNSTQQARFRTALQAAFAARAKTQPQNVLIQSIAASSRRAAGDVAVNYEVLAISAAALTSAKSALAGSVPVSFNGVTYSAQSTPGTIIEAPGTNVTPSATASTVGTYAVFVAALLAAIVGAVLV